MVTIQNSLSMNAINFQKAKSAPLAIKKNLGVNKPVQVNKKTVKAMDIRNMMADAKAQGVDPNEIVQDLLDKGYDIEPTTPQHELQAKIQQPLQNLVGGIASGFSKLGPNLAGGTMKGLGTPMFESYQKAQGVQIEPNILQKGGQELINRGQQMQNITEGAFGADPNAIGTQIGRQVAPMLATYVGGNVLGTNAGGMQAFNNVKTGLSARSLPTVAKGLTQGAFIGATEGAGYGVAEKGYATPQDIIYGAIGQTAFTALPLVQQSAKVTMKGIQNIIGGVNKVKNKVAEGLTASYLKNPAMREKYISKVGQAPEVTLLESGIKGSLPDQVKQISKLSSDSRNQARQSAQNIQENIASPEGSWITKKMIEGVDTTIPGIEKKMQPIIEMSKRFDEGTATAQDLIDAKTFLSRYESIYDDFGRVKKTGDIYEKEALADMYSVMKKQLEEVGARNGVDFREINRNTMKYEGLRDIATRAASREAGKNMLSLTDYIMGGYGMTGDPVTGMGALITKKALESPYIGSNVANFLYTKGKNVVSPVRNTNVPSGDILSMVGQKLIKKKAVPSELERIVVAKDEVPTKLKKLVAEKKTPLVKATSDLTTSIKKAKAEGKTFDEFVDGNTNSYFKKVDQSKLKPLISSDGKVPTWSPIKTDGNIGVVYRISPEGTNIRNGEYFTTSMESAKLYQKNAKENGIIKTIKEYKKPLKELYIDNQNDVIRYSKDYKKQLRTERDKLDQPTTPALGKPVKKVELPMKADEGLVAEARKYKSAEEMIQDFKKSKKVVFHGGKEKIDSFNLDNLATNEDNIVSKQGLFFAKDRGIAKIYAGDDGKITSAFLNIGDDKIYKIDYKGGRPLMDSVAGTIENAKKAGYKAVEIKGWRDGVGGTQYVVFDPKDIVTKSQIKIIYNK